MIIECDRCYARYKYDETRFEGKPSKKVRCTKCLSVFEIYNAQGQMVAQVKKKLVSMLGEKWWMENSSGREIAKMKGNIWEHDYNIQDMSGQPIAQIHKKWVSVRDSYCIEILNPSIDPYMIISYAISLDHTEKKEKH